MYYYYYYYYYYNSVYMYDLNIKPTSCIQLVQLFKVPYDSAEALEYFFFNVFIFNIFSVWG